MAAALSSAELRDLLRRNGINKKVLSGLSKSSVGGSEFLALDDAALRDTYGIEDEHCRQQVLRLQARMRADPADLLADVPAHCEAAAKQLAQFYEANGVQDKVAQAQSIIDSYTDQPQKLLETFQKKYPSKPKEIAFLQDWVTASEAEKKRVLDNGAKLDAVYAKVSPADVGSGAARAAFYADDPRALLQQLEKKKPKQDLKWLKQWAEEVEAERKRRRDARAAAPAQPAAPEAPAPAPPPQPPPAPAAPQVDGEEQRRREDDERRWREAEAEEMRRKQAEEEQRRREEAEAERRRQQRAREEEEAREQRAAEEARRRAIAEEQRRRREEEEAAERESRRKRIAAEYALREEELQLRRREQQRLREEEAERHALEAERRKRELDETLRQELEEERARRQKWEAPLLLLRARVAELEGRAAALDEARSKDEEARADLERDHAQLRQQVAELRQRPREGTEPRAAQCSLPTELSEDVAEFAADQEQQLRDLHGELIARVAEAAAAEAATADLRVSATQHRRREAELRRRLREMRRGAAEVELRLAGETQQRRRGRSQRAASRTVVLQYRGVADAAAQTADAPPAPRALPLCSPRRRRADPDGGDGARHRCSSAPPSARWAPQQPWLGGWAPGVPPPPPGPPPPAAFYYPPPWAAAAAAMTGGPWPSPCPRWAAPCPLPAAAPQQLQYTPPATARPPAAPGVWAPSCSPAPAPAHSQRRAVSLPSPLPTAPHPASPPGPPQLSCHRRRGSDGGRRLARAPQL